MSQKPTIWSFIRSFSYHWSDYMSGAPSVPLMLAALVIPDRWLAGATLLTGVACGILSAYLVWSRERALVLALTEQIEAKPLEIVLRHGPSFLHPLIVFNKTTGAEAAGNYWHIAVCNRTLDRTIRNVSLCVTQCSAQPIRRPFQLFLEGDTSDIPPQGHLLFVAACHMKNGDGTPSPISLCNSQSPPGSGASYSGMAIDAASVDIEVQAFSETAHAKQWFKLFLGSTGDLIIDPEVGSWDRRYEMPVMAFVSLGTPKRKPEAK